jgi:hypothetical protein
VRAHLEGWLDDRWVVEPYVQTIIPPGERRTLELMVAPPRQVQAEAGDYQLAVVVRTMEEIEHTARVGLVLTLLPFDRVQLDLAGPATPTATWWRRKLILPLHIANEGNHPLVLHLAGVTLPRLGSVIFPGNDAAAVSTVELQPGQRARVPVQLTVKRLPLVALHSRSLPFALTARATTGTVLQQLRSAVEVRPVIGAWQMASFAGLAAVGVAAVSLLLLVGALFLRASTADSQAVGPAVPLAPAVIVVTLNQPVVAPATSNVVLSRDPESARPCASARTARSGDGARQRRAGAPGSARSRCTGRAGQHRGDRRAAHLRADVSGRRRTIRSGLANAGRAGVY